MYILDSKERFCPVEHCSAPDVHSTCLAEKMHCTSDGGTWKSYLLADIYREVGRISKYVRMPVSPYLYRVGNLYSWSKILLCLVMLYASLVPTEQSIVDHSTPGVNNFQSPISSFQFPISNDTSVSVRSEADLKSESILYTVQKKIISTAYVQKGLTLYKKHLPFKDVRGQISKISMSLLDIAFDGSHFELVFGESGNKFYMSQWEARAVQNILRCEEANGEAVPLDILAAEKLVVSRKVITADRILIRNGQVTCIISGARMQGISCFRQLYSIAVKGGWTLGEREANDMYKAALLEYSETTLFVIANSTHVVLEQNPHCYVVCSLKSEGNGQTKDSTKAVLQQKYHRHLNEIYGKILSSFEAEIDLLQSIAVYSVRNGKLTEYQDKSELDVCAVFPGELLAELGMYEENFSVSRFHLSEFLGKHVDSYVTVSTEYRRIVNVVDKSCEEVQSNYLETLYSEHMALKQHINSQVRAFVKGRAVHMDDPWKVLCISNTNCMNVARTVEE